jgi:threonine/homoserine/homoserine lactone efflux protein
VNSFLAFLAVSLVVIVTPGPDTALTIRNSLFGGRSGGVFTAFGVSVGQAIWALATSLGIVALLVASEPLFMAVKYAGAAYLIYLGARSLHAALRPRGRAHSSSAGRVGVPGLRPMVALRQGAVSNLGNPKMAIFFASLLPQFAPAGAATFTALMALGLVFCAMTFLWLAAYAVIVAKAGDVLRRPGIQRAIEGVTGAILIALGVRIAAEHR